MLRSFIIDAIRTIRKAYLAIARHWHLAIGQLEASVVVGRCTGVCLNKLQQQSHCEEQLTALHTRRRQHVPFMVAGREAGRAVPLFESQKT